MKNNGLQGDPQILVCGSARLWREILGHVLRENFKRDMIQEVGDTNALPLSLLTPKDWLVWFFSSQHELQGALDQVMAQTMHPNLLLVASDGHALVRWSDHVELRRMDLSLDELLGILKVVPDPYVVRHA